MSPRRVQRRDGERGFALLLIFAMAAAVALLLYVELPRAVFESQRATEELLVDRGEQYKTAIKRFYMKTKTYPDSIDQLESTNGTRFLRRRYKDPFTNSTEWKIIKFGPAGELVDSVQSKKKGPLDKDDASKSTGSVVATSSLADVQNPTEQGPQSLALSRRPSDQGIGAQLAQSQSGSAAQGAPAGGPPPPSGQGNPNPYQQLPPSIPGVSQQQYQQLQQVLQQQQQQQQPQSLGPTPPPQGQPNQFPFQPGMAPLPGGLPGALPGGFPGGFPQQQQIPQQGPQPPRPGFQQIPDPTRSAASSQTQQPGQSNQALQMINQILTNPQNRLQVGQPTGAQTPVLAGKIAGFASKHKAEGIKVIEERTKINEWEFIYDFRKDKSLTGGMGAQGMPNQNANPLGGSGMNNSSFGNNSGSSTGGFGTGSGSTGSMGSGRGSTTGTRRQ